ncbi:MAG TPA: 2-C-methyl-D-erythritol 4-phosphate cytidylyltransferase [Steroidobacteraceae bacterium]|jgi:2-C-methyl-D-erythritol 4-phosphate cytidylyltransferase|nr:2-C-methyl-D-erythritol 4-phosphate cytidylyltransferase [Steroidobacteraceae bacterium]
MRYWLVVPAAGAGRRFGDRIPKQYAALHGRTVLEWALAPFVSDTRCAGAVVVIAPSDTWWAKISERIPGVTVVQGGGERCESVRGGLQALNRKAQPSDWVLVHDGVRPCLANADRDRLLELAGAHPVGGLLAVRTSDTLKRAQSDGCVESTVDRAELWRAATPQMFRYGRLCEALDRALAAKRIPTDESQAMEWLGDRPLLVECSAGNIKITTADDLALAEALLAARDKPSGKADKPGSKPTR